MASIFPRLRGAAGALKVVCSCHIDVQYCPASVFKHHLEMYSGGFDLSQDLALAQCVLRISGGYLLIPRLTAITKG